MQQHKILILILFTVVVALQFNQAQAKEDGTPLVIWTSNENLREGINALKTDFEQEFSRKIEVEVLNKDLVAQFKTAALAGKGPDILCWANDVVGDLANSGLIAPLTILPKIKKQIIPVALEAFTYQGKIYGYPYDIESIAMITNRNLIKTPPRSFAEIFKLHQQKITPPGNYLFLYDISSFFFSFPLLSAGGGYIYKSDNGTLDVADIGMDNKGAVLGANIIKKLIDQSIIPTSTDRSIAFSKMKEGKLAITIDGPWAIGELIKAKIPFTISPIPTIAGHRPKPFVGSHGFIVRRSSHNKELAFEFIENHLISKHGIKTLYKYDPRGPARLDALAELKRTHPELKGFIMSAKHGIPLPNVPEMSAVWGPMGNALSFIINGRKDVADALALAVKQIKATIQK